MAKVFLLCGQSNMVGAGVAEELPGAFRVVPDNVRFFEDGAFRELLWRDNFGPELGFARSVGPALGDEQVVLCKVARSGANLYYDWNPDGVSSGPEDDYRGPLYPELQTAYEELSSKLGDGGEQLGVAGVLWMQGERDSVFEGMAEAYRANLRAFIASVRRDFGDGREIPFLIGEIAPRVYDLDKEEFRHPFRHKVQSGQREAARTGPRTAPVETTGLPQSDNLHFDTAGQILLGRRFAEAYLCLVE